MLPLTFCLENYYPSFILYAMINIYFHIAITDLLITLWKWFVPIGCTGYNSFTWYFIYDMLNFNFFLTLLVYVFFDYVSWWRTWSSKSNTLVKRNSSKYICIQKNNYGEFSYWICELSDAIKQIFKDSSHYF